MIKNVEKIKLKSFKERINLDLKLPKKYSIFYYQKNGVIHKDIFKAKFILLIIAIALFLSGVFFTNLTIFTIPISIILFVVYLFFKIKEKNIAIFELDEDDNIKVIFKNNKEYDKLSKYLKESEKTFTIQIDTN